MSHPKVIRFEPHGPGDTGLAEWDTIDPGDLEAGNPVQRGHIYHQDEALGYMAGVWDCTAMTGKFEPYAVHEFMFLLEGSIIMVLEDGTEITVNAGEPFVIPKGLPCQWKQLGTVRKYFMIFEDPGAQRRNTVPAKPDLAARVARSGGEQEKRREARLARQDLQPVRRERLAEPDSVQGNIHRRGWIGLLVGDRSGILVGENQGGLGARAGRDVGLARLGRLSHRLLERPERLGERRPA